MVMDIYVFDTNVFLSLGFYYPKRFPTIWAKIDELADNGSLMSVREVRRELELNCAFEHVNDWINKYRSIFRIATNEECEIVANIFQKEQYRGLVRKNSILKGLPVADPFIVAAAKVNAWCVVSQESRKSGGARIPNVCSEYAVACINLEDFLQNEGLRY